MSAEATGYVYRHSPYTGAVFAVHLAIADTVNDQNGNRFYMRQGAISVPGHPDGARTGLAAKARTTRKTANEAVAKLIADGWLELLEDNSRAGKPSQYRFLFPAAPVVYESRWEPPDTPADTEPRIGQGDTAAAQGGVTTGDTPGVTSGYTPPAGWSGEGVTTGDTGCHDSSHRVSPDVTQNPIGTQEEPKNPSPRAPTRESLMRMASFPIAVDERYDDYTSSVLGWCAAKGIDLPSFNDASDEARFALQVVADELGTADRGQWLRLATTIICDYITATFGERLQPSAVRQLRSLVAHAGAAKVLEVAVVAVLNGAGIDEEYAGKPRAFVSYMAAVIQGQRAEYDRAPV